jgi:1,4-dihydroxy-2-naphthoate octaprenyltransferase
VSEVAIGGASTAEALYHLARPKLLPFVLLLVSAGYGWAHWDRALVLQHGVAFALVLASWSLLHAGTLWLNAALDRDEGEVLMGRVVPAPVGIVGYGYLALTGCVLLAFLAGRLTGVAASACAVLAVLYSHPRTAWKAHPLGGPAVNLVGYGLLSPFAGFSVVGYPWDERSCAAWLLGGIGVLGAYFAAQAFQREEDRARGYRTLVVTHGPQACVRAARLCIGIGFVGATVLTAIGWLPRVCLVAVPLYLWIDAHFRAWASRPGGGDERDAREMARRLLIAGLLAIGLCFTDYLRASIADQPVAGLATIGGHPPDRPLLPPRLMRQWEHSHLR